MEVLKSFSIFKGVEILQVLCECASGKAKRTDGQVELCRRDSGNRES